MFVFLGAPFLRAEKWGIARGPTPPDRLLTRPLPRDSDCRLGMGHRSDVVAVRYRSHSMLALD